MSFFKKLKDRMFRSSDKIGEGLEALVAEGATPDVPVPEVPEPTPPELPQPSRPEPVAPEPEFPEPELPEPNLPEPELPPLEDPSPMDRVLRTSPDAAAGTAAPGLLGRLFGRTPVEEPRRVLDDAMLESLEEVLIQADMGVDTAVRVTANIAEGRFGRRISTRELRAALAQEVARIMGPVARPMPLYPTKPQVVLVVGVNGSGKTTTIGKLASQFKAAGKSVVIAAGDTFRAAAVEQLQIWGQRAGVPVLTAPEGSDPAPMARTC
jgi:fused signal recognition particle receptor